MSGNIYGYVRVSSRDQNEDRQLMAFETLRIPKKNIYIDKQSDSLIGTDSDSELLVVHCAGGYNNVVVTGTEGFVSVKMFYINYLPRFSIPQTQS